MMMRRHVVTVGPLLLFAGLLAVGWAGPSSPLKGQEVPPASVPATGEVPGNDTALGNGGQANSNPANSNPANSNPANEPFGLDFLNPGGAGPVVSSASAIQLSASFQAEQGGSAGRLMVTAKLDPQWHVYSVTQPAGGPERTRIRLEPSADYQLVGPFQPDKPARIQPPDLFPVPVEDHSGRVTWTAPVKFQEGVDPSSLILTAVFDGQICEDMGSCVPIENRKLQAEFAGYYDAEPAESGEYRAGGAHVAVRGYLDSEVVAPGSTVNVVLTVVPDPGWHVYALSDQDHGTISKPTLIVPHSSGWQFGEPVASTPPVEKETGLPEEPIARYHDQPVTWTVPVTVPDDVAPGAYPLQGLLGYQVCSDNQCDQMTAVEFQAQVVVGDAALPGQVALQFTPTDYEQAAKLASERVAAGALDSATLDLDNIKPVGEDPTKAPIWQAILFALLGGFLLNFMPCVLPVIGLKIMSFVQQAGESRSKVFALNLWYSAGLLSVFMVLATLAVVWNLSWGEQNNFDEFNIPMVAIVFAMGLSFLGVWEIPIPGFATGGAAMGLASKEGAAGAFIKGAITTLLATPCSGPGVATALAWCSGKPPLLVYLVFAFMGVGMSMPYLVIGANPKLVRFIPKPGAWMETFKNVMGFVLLATVIWIMSYIAWSLLLPTIMVLFGLWAGLWWVGRTPLTAELPKRVVAWIGGLGFAAVIAWLAFGWLGPIMNVRLMAYVDQEISSRERRLADGGSLESEQTAAAESKHELPWKPFSEKRLKEVTSQRHTVLVDFTADWCQTCKWLERYVLNTESVRELVDEHEIVPLVANKSTRDPELQQEILKLMQQLGSTDVPLLAIFPAGRPNQPILLRGGYTQAELIAKLRDANSGVEQAGRSRGPAPLMASDQR